MIDLTTGIMNINGILIGPNVCLNDFLPYNNEIVRVRDRGNGSGIVRFINPINSNGIDASIKIELDEMVKLKNVIIIPSLANTNGMTLLDASKMWLRGMAKGEYIEKDDIITGKYDWGYINAQYEEDRDYGMVGGEINIHYNEYLEQTNNIEKRFNMNNNICPCCGKKLNFPVYEFEIDVNYTALYNMTEGFFDLVQMCPYCGFTMLFEHVITDDIKEYINSDEYKAILHNPNIDDKFKKWILIALWSEHHGIYTEAGIEYAKAFDYLIANNMYLDMQLIEKAASCFLSAVHEYEDFPEAILAIDCMRRDGEMEMAKQLLYSVLDSFGGNLVMQLTNEQFMWIENNDTSKKYIAL